jgi:hypothetical protein
VDIKLGPDNPFQTPPLKSLPLFSFEDSMRLGDRCYAIETNQKDVIGPPVHPLGAALHQHVSQHTVLVCAADKPAAQDTLVLAAKRAGEAVRTYGVLKHEGAIPK